MTDSPRLGVAVQFSITYSVPGDSLLARITGTVERHTDLAEVVLHRAADEPLRLTVVAHDEDFPEPQDQPSESGANMARAIQSSQGHIEILSRSNISLRGSPTELCCSVVTEEIDASMEEPVIIMADMILRKALTSPETDLSQAAARIE